jgi:hypothetical protein
VEETKPVVTAAEYLALGKKKRKRRKYHNIPTVVDGVKFDSMTEAKRYSELVLLRNEGEITDLECQPKYVLHVDGKKVGTYSADFRYVDRLSGETIVEDVKSPSTAKNPTYRLKIKMLKAEYGITVTEVYR